MAIYITRVEDNISNVKVVYISPFVHPPCMQLHLFRVSGGGSFRVLGVSVQVDTAIY